MYSQFTLTNINIDSAFCTCRQIKEILTISERNNLHCCEMLKIEALKRINILNKNISIEDNFNIIDIGGGTGEFITLFKKELLHEFRLKHSIGSVFLYVFATVFVCYFSFKSIISPAIWNALFWIILIKQILSY